ncbi:MAG: transposase [Planctomycetota bacterium]
MTNYRRAYVADGSYFFTVVTHHRRRFLFEPTARTALRQAVTDVRRRWPFQIDAIVLLPDHLHCVWTLAPGDSDFSTRWNQIKGKFSRAWLASGGPEVIPGASRSSRRERGVWQRRFFEHCCRDEQDYRRCVDYAHVNPLKHGLVKHVCDWRWSSFHRYVKLGEYARDWGNANEWYGDEWKMFE